MFSLILRIFKNTYLEEHLWTTVPRINCRSQAFSKIVTHIISTHFHSGGNVPCSAVIWGHFLTADQKWLGKIDVTFETLTKQGGNYLFTVNNGNTRTIREICSKLTIKILERRLGSRFMLILSAWGDYILVFKILSFLKVHQSFFLSCHALLISNQCCLSYRNHSIDSLCKTNDWFLYETQHCAKMG